MRARAWLLSLFLVACGGGAPLPGRFDPGVGGDALAGALEVITVDEASLEAIPATITVVHAGGALPEVRSEGVATVSDAALVGSISIHVSGVDRPQAIVGVTGSRVVIPIARPRVRTIDGSVAGASTLGASDVVVGALASPSFLRTDALDHAISSPCVDSAGGCRFALDDVPATSDTAVATLRDAAGAAIAFGVAPIEAAGEVRIDVADPAMRAAAVEIPVESPAAPPIGLEAVVGVPGLVTSAGVVLLDQMPSAEGTIAVPELAGAIGDGSWWLIAEAAPTFGDRSRRSVVLQRGLRAAADAGAFPAWLDAPLPVLEGGLPVLEPVAGATIYVVDWLAPNGAALASALVLDAAAPFTFAPEVGAARIRVRAVDAPGATPGALDLASVERAVVRFSEATVDL